MCLFLFGTGIVGGAAPASATDFADASRKGLSEPRRIELLRRAAWPYQDYIAQVELGRHYGAKSDFIEAFVWFYLATVNRSFQGVSDPALDSVETLIYSEAFKKRKELFTVLSTPDLDEAFQRITYILASRGAVGFVRLGELHDESVAKLGNSTPKGMRDTDRRFDPFVGLRKGRDIKKYDDSALPQNFVDALTYYHVGVALGHPYAQKLKGRLRDYLKKVVRLSAATIDAIEVEAGKKAAAWMPPFEVYASGAYSDYSPISGRREHALLRVHEIKLRQLQKALQALGYYYGPVDGDAGAATHEAIKHFQDANHFPPTGHLTALQTVLIIQLAALRQHAPSQTTLGYMYACGIGVVADELRAKYWLEKAYRQRYTLAAFNLGVFLLM